MASQEELEVSVKMLVGKGLQGKEMLPGFFDSVQKQAIGKLN